VVRTASAVGRVEESDDRRNGPTAQDLYEKGLLKSLDKPIDLYAPGERNRTGNFGRKKKEKIREKDHRVPSKRRR
jgi:hypothetical protein